MVTIFMLMAVIDSAVKLEAFCGVGNGDHYHHGRYRLLLLFRRVLAFPKDSTRGLDFSTRWITAFSPCASGVLPTAPRRLRCFHEDAKARWSMRIFAVSVFPAPLSPLMSTLFRSKKVGEGEAIISNGTVVPVTERSPLSHTCHYQPIIS